MSKFYRVILSLAGVCLVLGIMICIIAGVNGGFSILRNGIHNNWNFDYEWNFDNDNDNDNMSSRYDYEDINMTFDEDIKSLDITIPYGEVTIERGSEFSLKAEDVIKNSFSSTKVDDGVLKIEQDYNYRNNRNNFWNMFGFHIGKGGYKSPEIIITIPEDFVADEFNLDFEVGKIDIYDVNSIYSNLKLGVGDCYINNLKADKIDVLGSVGEIDMEDVTLKDLDFENQFGSVSIKGKLTGKCEISTGVGEAILDIDGDEDDYYIDLNKGLGEVLFNDSRISSSVGNSSAENQLNVDTGVGEVRIYID